MTHDEYIKDLISAYVDGEVSVDERTRVESLLSRDGSLREYCAELRSLRREVQALPRLTLPGDFAQRVLLRVREREGLSLGTPVTPAATPETAQDTRAVAAWRQPWLIGLVSLAAGLLLAAAYGGLGRSDRGPRIVQAPSVAPRGGNTPTRTLQAPAPASPGEQPGPGAVAAANPTPSRPPSTPLGEPSEAASGAVARNRPPAAIADNRPTSGQSPADREPANVPSSREQPAEDPAGRGEPVPLYLVDVVVTQAGLRDQVFEQALLRAGISWKNALAVDARLEKALLADRIFGALGPGDLEANPALSPQQAGGAELHFRLVLLWANGRQHDAVQRDLAAQRQTGAVAAIRRDLALGIVEMDLAHVITELAHSPDDVEPTGVRAHPLTVDDDARDRLHRALVTSRAKDGAWGQAVAHPPMPVRPLITLPPGVEFAPPPEERVQAMDAEQFPALFVIRSESAVRAAGDR